MAVGHGARSVMRDGGRHHGAVRGRRHAELRLPTPRTGQVAGVWAGRASDAGRSRPSCAFQFRPTEFDRTSRDGYHNAVA